MSSLATMTKQKQSIQTALNSTTINKPNRMTSTLMGDVAVNPMRKFENTGFTKLAKVNSGNFNA